MVSQRPLRLLMLTTHPNQHASPIFRRIAQDERLDIHIAYCSMFGVDEAHDPEFDRSVAWDIPLLDGYRWTVLHNIAWKPGHTRFFGLLNPEVISFMKTPPFDAVVVYGYGYATSWLAMISARLRRIPVVMMTDASTIGSRHQSRLKRQVKRLLLPMIYRVPNVIGAASKAGIEYIRSLKVPARHIHLIPNVVDNDYWIDASKRVDQALVRSEWGIPQDGFVVFFAGKFQPWKRPLDPIRALPLIPDDDIFLVMAGDGPLLRDAQVEAQRLGVRDRVRFLSLLNQTEMPGAYATADLVVLPSEFDSSPTVVCEAMLCGTPVVMSDAVKGRLELVKDGVTGYLYPCGDTAALAKKLQMLHDRAAVAALSSRARKRMETWSPQIHADALIEALESTMRLSSARPS